MERRFNIRVYGILIKEKRLLINEEIIRGAKVFKLPGGGLEPGEGLVDCLKREWKEELGIDIEVKAHFYTTDFFVQSAYDNSQIISIYYLVEGPVPEYIVNHVANETTYWIDLAAVNNATFTLIIDRHVGGMLQQLYNNPTI